GMGVDDAEGGVLAPEIGEDAGEGDVLDHIGEIAGVEGVAVVHGAYFLPSASRMVAAKAMKTAAKLQLSALPTHCFCLRVRVSHSANSTTAMTTGSETMTNSTPRNSSLPGAAGS